MMMIVAITACAVCLLMALVRTALGPTAFDRVLAVNAIGTLVILGIALHGFIMERPEFVDIALLFLMINKELVEKKIENDLILKNKVEYLKKNLKLIDNNFIF